MNLKHTKNDVKITGPIVKIAWLWHNRKYEIGVKHFLEVLGVEISDEEILAAVRKILSEQ